MRVLRSARDSVISCGVFADTRKVRSIGKLAYPLLNHLVPQPLRL